MKDPDKRRALREAFDRGDWDAADWKPDAEAAAVIERNADGLRRMQDAGAEAKPISSWAEVAAWVDDATWDRILGDLTVSRAEAEAIRAPSGRLPFKGDEEKAA